MEGFIIGFYGSFQAAALSNSARRTSAKIRTVLQSSAQICKANTGDERAVKSSLHHTQYLCIYTVFLYKNV